MDFTSPITSVGHGGYGITRIEGQVCFVPYALPGDTIRGRIIRKTKGVLWGDVLEILEPSPDRTAAPCKCFGRCGGCNWLHFAYPAQGEWKRRIVHDCLKRIGGIEAEVGWLEEPTLRLGYRTRAEFQCAEGLVGFFAPNSHDVVDIASCPLCHPRLNEVLEGLKAAKPSQPVEVVVNPEGMDIQVWTRKPDRRLHGAFPEPKEFLFDGVPVVPGAFTQSSLLLNRLLVREVIRMVDVAEKVLDLYCGNGNFALRLSNARQILGIDHNRRAIDAAQAVGRGEFRSGDEVVFCEALRKNWDAVILDPPRTGAKAIVPALAKCDTAAIIYVSCDPATLARDLKILVAAGWHVEEAVAVDIFPHTAHVETVCRLSRTTR